MPEGTARCDRATHWMHRVMASTLWLVFTHSAALSDTADELGPTVEPLVYEWSYCIYGIAQDDDSVHELPTQIINRGFQHCKAQEAVVRDRLLRMGKSPKDTDSLMLKLRDDLRREFMKILCGADRRECASS